MLSFHGGRALGTKVTVSEILGTGNREMGRDRRGLCVQPHDSASLAHLPLG